jgi:Zn finger protein HypA/HybF involved in hydrogenase expression
MKGESRMSNKDQTEATTELSFKCANCGHMYPTDNLRERSCPVCGHVNDVEEGCLVNVSNEGY